MSVREGSLEAPTRHPVAWKTPDFWNELLLEAELERIFDICHGCRRCVSLCNAFPTLFDLIDELSAECNWVGWIGCEYRPVRGLQPGGTTAGLGWLRNLTDGLEGKG